MEDLNKYIKKSHIKAVAKFNDELKAFAEECGEEEATVYEDACISFTLSDVKVENGCLCYLQDGERYEEKEVGQYEDTLEYYEEEGLDSIPEYLKFWRACLRRAKRYWTMDPDKLDSLQDGHEEDDDTEDQE